MSRCINRKNFNHQQATRRKSFLKKSATRKVIVLDKTRATAEILAGRTDSIVNEHQRQALNSNPRANVKLSKKKIKKIVKRAKIVQRFNQQIEMDSMEA